jgi:hypothetical protein
MHGTQRGLYGFRFRSSLTTCRPLWGEKCNWFHPWSREYRAWAMGLSVKQCDCLAPSVNYRNCASIASSKWAAKEKSRERSEPSLVVLLSLFNPLSQRSALSSLKWGNNQTFGCSSRDLLSTGVLSFPSGMLCLRDGRDIFPPIQ